MLIGRPGPQMRAARFVEHRAGFEPAALRLCRPFPWSTRAPVHLSGQNRSETNGSAVLSGSIGLFLGQLHRASALSEGHKSGAIRDHVLYTDGHHG